MPLEDFHKKALPYYKEVIRNESIDLMKISKLVHERVEVLSDVAQIVDFFESLPEYDINLYVHKKMKTDLQNSLENLKLSYEVLERLESWNEESIDAALKGLVEILGVKNGLILWPVRTAISGKQVTPGGAIEIADILGKEESLRRMRIGIEKLAK